MPILVVSKVVTCRIPRGKVAKSGNFVFAKSGNLVGAQKMPILDISISAKDGNLQDMWDKVA